jgi:type II secretion system protein N
MKFEKIITLALLILSLLVLAGFLPVRFGAFNGIAEKALREAGADSVSVESVSVALFAGVRINDLRAYKRINAKEGYWVRVERVDIRCNLPWLVAVGVLAHHSPLAHGEDLFRNAYESPFGIVGGVCGYWMSVIPLKEIALRGADVSVTNKKGQPGIAVTGVSMKVRKASSSVFGGKQQLNGSVNVAKTTVPALAKIENFSIKLQAESNSGGNSLNFINGRGSIFGGKLNANLSLDLDSKIYSLAYGWLNVAWITGGNIRISGLDLERFSAETGFSPGTVSGKLDLDAQMEYSSAYILDAIKANGNVAITNLTAADLALQKSAAVNQVSRDLRTLQFSKITSDINLYGGKVNFNEIAGTSDILSFKSTGWIDFDGKLHQNFDGEFTPQFVSGLPKLVRNSLEKTPSDGGRFKCRITGTFHKPRVEVDKSVYNRALRNLFK